MVWSRVMMLVLGENDGYGVKEGSPAHKDKCYNR